MKILIAHNGRTSCDTAVDDSRSAGLPETAQVLILCAAGQRSALQKGDSTDSWKTQLDAAEMLAEAASKRLESYFPKWNVSSEAITGSPAEVILNTTNWWRPELVIIDSNAFALEREMTSNVALEVAHRARCSVRLARREVTAHAGGMSFVIGNAGSMACEAVINEVARRRWPKSTEAHIVSVTETKTDYEAHFDRSIEGAVDQLRNAGVSVNQRFVEGDPRHDLVKEAERCNADTVFIGARTSPTMQRFLLGSVATAVVTRALCTVEVVRPPS